MWFTGWQPIGRAVLFSVLAYVVLIALIRVLGKRTISKMNPGDFVVRRHWLRDREHDLARRRLL